MTFTHHNHDFNWVVNLVSYVPAFAFICILIGVIIEIQFPTSFLPAVAGWLIGGVLIVTGTVVVVWSQHTRRTLYIPISDRSCFNFYEGPYKVSRHPTYLGLLGMMLGLSFAMNSLLLIAITALFFVFLAILVIPHEEKALEDVCGGVYITYKKQVRKWI